MRSLLPLMPKPSRYAGIEDNACIKDPAAIRLRVALAFPDTYDVGMSYLGQKILYGIVNSHPQWWAERVMAPEREAGEVLRAHNTPLATLESDTPLGDMHCLCFSITHELCYTNVLYMLDLANLPLRSQDRPQDLKACPLVIAGGGALLSAEPLTPFVDMMVLGDGEESLPELLHLLENAHQRGWTRTQFLEHAYDIKGVYVPSFFVQDYTSNGEPIFPLRPQRNSYTRPARRIVADLNNAPYPTKQVVPIGAVHNRLSIEIARGCTRSCRFCHAGMVYRPARERALNDIHALVDKCLKETGFDEISFLSLSTGDFSALKSLSLNVLDRCANEQISLSLPSLRVGSIDDAILERMSHIRRTGCTLAPEAGSQRLRDVINKGITEEELLLHAQKLLEHGWRMVKLYFMLGLPTETDDDLNAIADICGKVRDAAGPGGPRLQVTAALSPFVPKPFTPFQWAAQIGVAEIQRRVDIVRRSFKGQKLLKLRWHEPAMSHLEGILSRADRRMADVVEKAYRKGAIFASWMDHFTLTPWLEALEECGLTAQEYTGPRKPGDPMPWSHLEAGVSDAFLLREWRRALEGKVTSDCRYSICHQCGACDTKAGPSRLPHADHFNPDDPTAHLHCNRLIFAQRDQQAHTPARDAQGHIIFRQQQRPVVTAELTVKAVQYRVWHTKTGGSAFLSQLELQTALERALRRAGIPLAFSQGFHPMPLLSFGRALPVGVESLAEWFAMTLHHHMPPEDITARVTPFLPRGIAIYDLEQADKEHRTAQAMAEAFVLHLSSPEQAQAAQDCFADFARQQDYILTRETKKGTRTMDIRPILRHWDAKSDEDNDTAKPVVTFVADWSTLYLSPLVFCMAVLAPLGTPDALKPHIALCKTAQIFPDGRTRPANYIC
ncbi:MAG: TIGR03960 family B12-binding radical SAM protein [Desulfovibrio sp.]|nr:TIGR03960 family B12-binding radical SAM protein [Desulfovibrio sp.]